MVNVQTKLFFSIASNPGIFGSHLYNKAFKELGINAIYKPLKLEPNIQLGELVALIHQFFKKIGVCGVSVSMPFKKLAYLAVRPGDEVTDEIKIANTIVIKDNNCLSYNTDCVGFEKACENMLNKSKNALIFGCGNAANSISY
ncbi:MAG: hypothetical protein AABY22_17285, partial [Nanoarchaeota archaeon]